MAGKISELQIALTVSDEDWLEIIQARGNGEFENYRIKLSQLARGLSAYEIAIQNGYEGTEQEWLVSLVGKSAYEIAQSLGYPGTEAEWIASLKGDQGDSAYAVAVSNGYVGDVATWLESLRGQSAYAVAQEQGYTGTVSEWLDSIKGEKGDKGDKGDAGDAGIQGMPGKTAYQAAVDGGFEGTEEEFNSAIAKPRGINGAVFITDITPQNGSENVGNKQKSADTVSLLQCSSTTRNVNVVLRALTGHTNYRPVVLVNGTPATMTAGSDAPLFNGTVAIELPEPNEDGEVVIRAEHEDGAYWETTVTFDTPPAIQNAVFATGYPGSQTELKAGDRMDVHVVVDGPVVAYEIQDFGAFVAASGAVSGTEFDVSNLAIANRGNSTQSLGFRIRVQKASGSWSGWFESTSAGIEDLTHVVNLNNLYPSVTMGVINYPNSQLGIKAGDSAVVNHTVTNADSVAYTTLNNQLSIAAPGTYEAAKTVEYQSGDYNATSPNFLVAATKASNGAVTNANAIVAIANVAPTISISTPAARLRSGGNNGTSVQNHLITLTSTQALASAPNVNAPEGTWEAQQWQSNAAKTIWTRRLQVHDNDDKGTFTFSGLVATSLSGMEQNAFNGNADYVLGGFVIRTLTVQAFPNREVAIGTDVSNTAKLRCSNLSKGSSGSLNFTYQGTVGNVVDRYTITSPSGVANAQGDTWYNCDAGNASSNTGGTMQIELEEVI